MFSIALIKIKSNVIQWGIDNMNWKLSSLFFLVVGFYSHAQPVKHAPQNKKTYSIGLSENPPISFLNKDNQETGMIY